MGWRELAKDYLNFSRKERIGIIAVICLIVFIWLSPRILRNIKSQKTTTDTSWMTIARKLQAKPESMDSEQSTEEGINSFAFERSVEPGKSDIELFYFDPNTLSPNDWRRLGLNEKTVHTIENYLRRGGHFFKPSDLQKIYGLKPGEFARLEPYIRIDEMVSNREVNRPITNYNRERSSGAVKTIDINTADSTAFALLPGIGNRLSARLVNFRDRLGGFFSVDQVGEVYGLADSTFQKIKKYLSVSGNSLRTLNINTATKDEMKSHPYFRWALANAIVEYRNQHGNFSSLEDLKRISLVTDEIFNKIRPYLTL